MNYFCFTEKLICGGFKLHWAQPKVIPMFCFLFFWWGRGCPQYQRSQVQQTVYLEDYHIVRRCEFAPHSTSVATSDM